MVDLDLRFKMIDLKLELKVIVGCSFFNLIACLLYTGNGDAEIIIATS